jgi:hypothetical protein
MIYESDNVNKLSMFSAQEIDWAYSCLKRTHDIVTDEMIREYILCTEQ